jgi:uncharacterized protein
VLRHTFLHVPGIGRTTERTLWAKGICSWDHAVDAIKRFPERLGAAGHRLEERLPATLKAAKAHDAAHFERLAAFGESWRMYREFVDSCVFLDIETTGLSPQYDDITVVGLYDGQKYSSFVKNDNLQSLPQRLKQYEVVITFNGSGFDLPFLQAKLPVRLPCGHIDLRWTTYKMGHRGGLIAIEPQFGVKRSKRLAGIDGFEAVRLWNQYRRGDKGALELLIDYNREDVINLKTIMDNVYTQLTDTCIQSFPASYRKVFLTASILR